MIQSLLAILLTITIGGVGCAKQESIEQPKVPSKEIIEDVVNDDTQAALDKLEGYLDEVDEAGKKWQPVIDKLNKKYSDKLYGTLVYEGSMFIVRTNNDSTYYQDEAVKKETLTISKDIVDTLKANTDGDITFCISTSDWQCLWVSNLSNMYFTDYFGEQINDLTTYIK